GDAAATAADFTLNAAGRIELRGDISAQTDLAVSTTATQTDALTVEAARLSAAKDLALNAAGGAALAGGTLVAGEKLTVQAGSLSDTAQIENNGDDNKRYGAAGTRIEVAGAAGFDGTTWGSGADLTVDAGSLNATTGATLYGRNHLSLSADDGDLSLGDAAVLAGGDVTLSASGNLSIQAGEGQRVVAEQGTLRANVGGDLDNAGLMASANGDVSLDV